MPPPKQLGINRIPGAWRLRCVPGRKRLHPKIPAPAWQDLLNENVKAAQQKRGRDGGECSGLKPKREGMLLRENGTARKQEENQMGGKSSPAEPWEQAGIREEETLSLLLIWDQRAEGCGVCEEKQMEKEEFKLKAADCALLWDSNGQNATGIDCRCQPRLEGVLREVSVIVRGCSCNPTGPSRPDP